MRVFARAAVAALLLGVPSLAMGEDLIPERRAIVNNEPVVVPRVSDLLHMVSAARGKLELTMSEEDGQEDKLIERIVAEAVKNVFIQYADAKEFRPIVEAFDAGKSIELGDTLPAAEVLSRVDRIPGLRKRAEALAERLQPDPTDPEAREAVVAGMSEFILEGLHVHNKLNKNARAGGTTYRR